MSNLSFTGFAVADDSTDHSRITDLFLHEGPNGAQLYSSTRYDGVLQHWTIGSGTLTVGGQLGFAGLLQAGAIGGLGMVSQNGNVALLTGGAAGGDLQLVTLSAGGGLGVQSVLASLPSGFDSLQHTTTVNLANGNQAVFGAVAGGSGIARLRFDSQGVLLDHAILQDPTPQTAAKITGTAAIEIGNQTYLLTVSNLQNGLTSRIVSPDGSLSFSGSVGVDDGLWINAPTGVVATTLGGVAYAIIASANSDSLSVVEIAANGDMVVRDHVMDTRDTRFGGVAALEIVTHDGKTYAIAGGGDDGISVFSLLEGGLLVHRAHIADTVDMSLDNISAIAARGTHSGLDIFVASSSEAGVTLLRYDTGTGGLTATATLAGGILAGTHGRDVLQGHDGDDQISSGAGDDILRDGGGQDSLSGGDGRDLFILSADGSPDTITDFTPGEDQIDLSLWPMLRDMSQLTISLRSDGMQIIYGSETLIVQSADGGPIDYRDLTSTDLIGASRLPVNLTPGYPGPATPIDNGPSEQPAGDQGGPHNPASPLTLISDGNLGILRDALNRPHSGAGGVETNAGAGADTITGSGGPDLIFAGDGNDTISAVSGNDTVFARGGDDVVMGGDGADSLYGDAGEDRLEGGFGDDLLTGGADADTFVFSGGNDVIADHESGIDSIILDARLWTGLTSADDLLLLYSAVDAQGITISFDTGDTLTVLGVFDSVALADDITLF